MIEYTSEKLRVIPRDVVGQLWNEITGKGWSIIGADLGDVCKDIWSQAPSLGVTSSSLQGIPTGTIIKYAISKNFIAIFSSSSTLRIDFGGKILDGKSMSEVLPNIGLLKIDSDSNLSRGDLVLLRKDLGLSQLRDYMEREYGTNKRRIGWVEEIPEYTDIIGVVTAFNWRDKLTGDCSLKVDFPYKRSEFNWNSRMLVKINPNKLEEILANNVHPSNPLHSLIFNNGMIAEKRITWPQ